MSRNWPGAADMAGKPPALASATPGVVTKKVSVIRYVDTDMRAPSAEKMGRNAPTVSAAAVESSMIPTK